MTYHIQHVKFSRTDTDTDTDANPPIPADPRATWLKAEGVESANVGTGVKKVWAQVYGAWGKFEVDVREMGVRKGVKSLKGGRTEIGDQGKVKGKGKGKGGRQGKVVKKEERDGEKVVKKIMMPLMPKRET
jgi:A/G-specific adenine glycosylase